MPTIAVIGTGNMGAPMSLNLVRGGFTVKAYDIVEEKTRALEKDGVIACGSHAEAIIDSDAVLTMLPSEVEVREVVCGPVFENAAADTIVIDSSTINLDDARELHALSQEKDLRFLDAPVSGGTMGAASGNLTFMVGGETSTLQAARKIFEPMAKNIIHCGGPAMGQATKMCNNLMLGIQMASVAEAFNLARRVGLDEAKLFEVAGQSSGNCAAMNVFCPVPGLVESAPSSNDYLPGFTAALMLKDMNLALAAAQRNTLDLNTGKTARKLYQQMVDEGDAEIDFSSIYRLFKRAE